MEKQVNNFIGNWISINYYVLKRICMKYDTSEFDDIYHEVIIQFLQADEDLLIKLILMGNAIKYFRTIFKINCYSPNSIYQQKYNKIKYVEIFNDVEDEVIDKYIESLDLIDLDKVLKEIDSFFIDKIIFREYIINKIEDNTYSFRQMSDDAEFNMRKLIYSYTKVKDNLKSYIKNKNN